MLRDIGGGCGGGHTVGRHHRHTVGVLGGDAVKIGQFVDAGGAPGTPEVQHRHLTGAGGVDGVAGETVAVHHRHGVAGTAVAHRHLAGHRFFLIPEIGEGAEQHRQHRRHRDNAGDQPLFALRCRGFIGGGYLVLFNEDVAPLPADGAGGADGDALAAADALLVAYVVDVGLAVGDALVAVHAFIAVELNTEHRNAVKQAVESAQRAQEATEQTEHEDATHQNAHHHQELPGEDGTQHREVAVVDLVGQQQDAALQRTGGTDVLTECGERGVPQGV